MEEKPKLRFGKVTGHLRLKQEEELDIACQGAKHIEQELAPLLGMVGGKSFSEVMSLDTDIQRLNSLIWVYIELEGVRVSNNVRIAAAAVGLLTINQIAEKAYLNASFLGKLLSLEPGGGWNLTQIFKISTVIQVDPRVMLFSDLAQVIKDEEKKYK